MAHARKIMVIRHGEKPPDNPPPNGVDPDGRPDPESLTPRGWQRALALIRLFDPPDGELVPGLGIPSVLVASSPRENGSKRPVETLIPLAQHLNLTINDAFHPSAYQAAVKFARDCEDVSLVCWRHEDIPAIGESLSGRNSVPAVWPGDRFDVVWVFDYEKGSGRYTFSQTPQNLLQGDPNSTIPN